MDVTSLFKVVGHHYFFCISINFSTIQTLHIQHIRLTNVGRNSTLINSLWVVLKSRPSKHRRRSDNRTDREFLGESGPGGSSRGEDVSPTAARTNINHPSDPRGRLSSETVLQSSVIRWVQKHIFTWSFSKIQRRGLRTEEEERLRSLSLY